MRKPHALDPFVVIGSTPTLPSSVIHREERLRDGVSVSLGGGWEVRVKTIRDVSVGFSKCSTRLKDVKDRRLQMEKRLLNRKVSRKRYDEFIIK